MLASERLPWERRESLAVGRSCPRLSALFDATGWNMESPASSHGVGLVRKDSRPLRGPEDHDTYFTCVWLKRFWVCGFLRTVRKLRHFRVHTARPLGSGATYLASTT